MEPVASLSNTESVGLSYIPSFGRSLALSSHSVTPAILRYIFQFAVAGQKHGVMGRSMLGCIHRRVLGVQWHVRHGHN